MPSTIVDTNVCKVEEEQIGKSIHDFGSIWRGIVVLRCSVLLLNNLYDNHTSSHHSNVDVTGSQYPCPGTVYGMEGSHDMPVASKWQLGRRVVSQQLPDLSTLCPVQIKLLNTKVFGWQVGASVVSRGTCRRPRICRDHPMTVVNFDYPPPTC